MTQNIWHTVWIIVKGLILKKGVIVESTIIAAPSSTKNREKERDPDTRQAKKGNTWYWGYKAHVGVDKISLVIAGHDTRVDENRRPNFIYHSRRKIWFWLTGVAWRFDSGSPHGNKYRAPCPFPPSRLGPHSCAGIVRPCRNIDSRKIIVETIKTVVKTIAGAGHICYPMPVCLRKYAATPPSKARTNLPTMPSQRLPACPLVLLLVLCKVFLVGGISCIRRWAGQPAQNGEVPIPLLPQACIEADEYSFCAQEGLQTVGQFQPFKPHRPKPALPKLRFPQAEHGRGWGGSSAFPPARVGCIFPSSRTCA